LNVTTQGMKRPFLEGLAPLICVAAFVGIPVAGGVAVLGLLQIPRLLYDRTNPVLGVAEVISLLALPVLVLLLRYCLGFPGAPGGLYRNVLDFLAMRNWHPALIAALIVLLVLPGVWFSHVDRDLFFLLRIMGWPRVLKSGDFRDDMDRVATLYQLALMGGIPLLFGLHMVSRWQTKRSFLIWLLVPLFFLGLAVAVVVIGTIAHFANN
jgi:hypothetical protein